MKSLEQELEKVKVKVYGEIKPQDLLKFYDEAEDLVAAEMKDNIIKASDILPEFKLEKKTGEIFSSSELLSTGPLVISFFRGSWCPFCNVEMKALQDILEGLKQRKATLIGITPDTFDKTIEIKQNLGLEYDILHDSNNEYGKKLGIVYELSDYVIEFAKEMGVDISHYQGTDKFELPIPATIIVDSNSKVLSAFIEPDYTKRMDPEDILVQLDRL